MNTNPSFSAPNSSLKRRKPTVRSLRPGETRPEGEPRRFGNSAGYVRLRWKVAKGQYVETYDRDEAGALIRTRPSLKRVIDHDEIARLYAEGLSTPQIGRKLKMDASVVSRSLARQGVRARTSDAYARPVDADEVVRRYLANEGYSAIGNSLGISLPRIKATLVERGIELRPPGMIPGRKFGPKKGPVSYKTEFQRAVPLLRERSGGMCEAHIAQKCSGRGTHAHHRKLRSQGGLNDLATLFDVCIWCHAAIHANPAISYKSGLLVRQAHDPALIEAEPERWLQLVRRHEDPAQVEVRLREVAG